MANLDAKGMADKIQEDVSDFLEQDVNIAVCGRSGTGKSSLVNCMLNKRASENGAAKVGVNETTASIKSYKNPNIPKVVIWDLPGVGTQKFGKDSYLEEIAFSNYDAFIIVCANRIFEEDIWLAKQAHSEGKPFYFVRSRVDQEIRNARRDHGTDAETTLSEMRDNAQENLKESGIGEIQVFLVSSGLRHQTKGDYPELMDQLIKNTPRKNVTALVMSMVSCSIELIARKRADFQKRIPDIVEEVGRPDAPYLERVMTEIDLYVKMFGVSNQDMEKWHVEVIKLELQVQELQEGMQDIYEAECKEKEKTIGWKLANHRCFRKLPLAKSFLDNLEMSLAKFQDFVSNTFDTKAKELIGKCIENILSSVLESCEKVAVAILAQRNGN